MMARGKRKSYGEGFHGLGILSLRNGRMYGDRIEAYKIVRDRGIKCEESITVRLGMSIRSHSLRLGRYHTGLQIRVKFFTNR